MIRKPTIIITSLGRTGTKFFYTLFQKIIPNGTSLHEPDVFNIVQYQRTGERIREIIKQIRESGAYNFIIRKSLGKWSLVKLSDVRVRGGLDYTTTVQQVLSQRKDFVHSRNGDIYIESSLAYYGLIDVLPDVYEHHRVAYIIRDGRDWVQSWVNWGDLYGGMYGKGRIGRVFGHNWPTASEMKEDPYKLKWVSMSRFEKLCWAWNRLNKYAIEQIGKNPSARLVRFEDIFKSDNRYEYLEELVRFLGTLPLIEPIAPNSLEGLLDEQVHKSTPQFPLWEEWPAHHKQYFKTVCGSLMEELGYQFS